jgi:Skp family chaperone for outer membrane proteins
MLMKEIKERLETFRLAIEELQAEFNYVSGAGNRNTAVALEQEQATVNLRTLLEESKMEWEQLKKEVEKGFAGMQDQIDSLQASLQSEREAAAKSKGKTENREDTEGIG